MKKTIQPRFVQWFSEIGIEQIPEVGGKNASLGEMYRELNAKGVRIPDGFAINVLAYRDFLCRTNLDQVIAHELRDLDAHDLPELRRRSQTIQAAILAGPLSEDFAREVCAAYDTLSGVRDLFDVAVRSSATAEDLPEASFAGQQESFLNVRGHGELLDACKHCYASLFSERAIAYRVDQGFKHESVALSIGVQRMVRSDLASAGVMFTLDTESGFRDVVIINSAYGLGENVVKGVVNPDEFTVFKPTLMQGYEPIISRKLGGKEWRLSYAIPEMDRVHNLAVPIEERRQFSINSSEVLTLARWACVIEKHYSAKNGAPCPMDIEWAKDGHTGELYILQARPETVQSRRKVDVVEVYKLGQHDAPLVVGRSIGARISHGPVHIINNVEDIQKFKPGEVLVTSKTDPDWEPIMKQAAAIVTERGGRTCHAAIVSRELGVPAIVGAVGAMHALNDSQEVTVCCAEGDTGAVYDGNIPFEMERIFLEDLSRPHTKIMINVGNPDEAFRLSFLPNDGVGLAREEFIVSNSIKVHPMALLAYDEITDLTLRAQLEEITAGYGDKPQFFIDKLAERVGTIAAAFYPKDVIVRLSDFKTNEYANLVGGAGYEPHEENPMLGFRGASRYYDPAYQEAFALECAGMRKVREEMGLTNVKLMVPFCRTLEEGRKVLTEMARHGLKRGENGLEVYVMCEIPSNVILADEFSKLFDGFSIGSNDLTQLILGVDRDSEIVAHVFDERDQAVKVMIRHVIQQAKAIKVKIGICGQAPSDYPEFARFLVECGIDSISLNPDSVLQTTTDILVTERDLSREIEQSNGSSPH